MQQEITPILYEGEVEAVEGKTDSAEIQQDEKADLDATGHVDQADAKGEVTYEAAARAEDFEHSLGLWQSIKIYKVVSDCNGEIRSQAVIISIQALWWSFVASLSIIMEGYDLSVGGGASLLEYRKVNPE